MHNWVHETKKKSMIKEALAIFCFQRDFSVLSLKKKKETGYPFLSHIWFRKLLKYCKVIMNIWNMCVLSIQICIFLRTKNGFVATSRTKQCVGQNSWNIFGGGCAWYVIILEESLHVVHFMTVGIKISYGKSYFYFFFF